MRLNNMNSMKRQIMIWFLKKNLNITEEALEHIHLDPDQNFPYPKISSDIMPIHHNDKENIIDDPEYFFPIPQLTNKCTQGGITSSNYHQS